jgi:outer membrane receptor for ferrienterochelin and colicins
MEISMKQTLSATLCALCSTVSALTFAAEEDLFLLYGDDDMVSIATGTYQPITKAPSTASIITAEDIKAMGAITLDEVLESVPGLHVVPSTLDRMNPVYTIRGIYTGFNPQVLFLLNGNRIVSSLFTGGLSLNSRMNVENISRIEVIRGPGSAVYGADAYAGVINIVTKSSDELNGLNAGVRGGSFNTKNTWAQYGGALSPDWNMALSIEYAAQDADESRVVNSDFQSVFDAPPPAGLGTSASLTPSYLDQRYETITYNLHLNNERWNIGVDGWNMRDRGLGAGAAQAIDHAGHDSFDYYILSTQYRNRDIADNWELGVDLSHQVAELDSYFNLLPAGTVLPIGSDGNINAVRPAGIIAFPNGVIGNPGGTSTVTQADMIALYDGFESHEMRFNIGGKREEGTTNEKKNYGPVVITDTTVGVVDGTLTDVTGTIFSFGPDKTRTVSYVSLQDVWNLYPDWTLTAGIRYDDYSDFGGTTNPRAALVWNTSQHLTTKLLYGHAFRAPSFSELYSRNNPVVLGNPNLKPETINTLELAFTYELESHLKAGFNIYQYRTDNMIDFVPNGDGTNTAQNIKSLDGKGLEVEADWQISKQWELISNYAYQSTRNRSTDDQEPLAPQRQLYLDARWEFLPDWRLSSQINWISDRERVNFFTGARENVDGYTWVNLTLRNTNLLDNWEIAASIKNVFDEDAVEPSDGRIPDNYPLNERAYYLEVRYKQ